MEQFECLVYLMFEFASYFHSDYKDLTSCTSVMCSRFFKTLLSLFLQMNSTRYNLMKALGRTKVFSLSRCFFLAMILVFMRGRRTTLHLLGLIHLIISLWTNGLCNSNDGQRRRLQEMAGGNFGFLMEVLKYDFHLSASVLLFIRSDEKFQGVTRLSMVSW